MIVEYYLEEAYAKELEVEDPGNTCIRCTTDGLYEFYIMTKTVLGKTSFITFGPVLPDMADTLLGDFTFSYVKFDYSEAKLVKSISSFINNPKKKITESEVIDEDEAMDALPNLVNAYKNIELEENNY